ncbi:MAG: branched-chain amino acid ABC transporter permease [Rubrivivax sp.]
MSRSSLVFLLVLLVMAAAPWLGLYPVHLMNILCWALFACAFHLLLGFGGLLSFGHAMFFGGAAYVSGYAMTAWHLGPALSILAGTLAAAAVGLAAGAVAIRRQGIYFAMITLALSQFVYFALLQAPFTGGENGLQDIPRGRLFGLLDLSNEMTMYYAVMVVFAAGYLGIAHIVRSPFGQVLIAIRENEPRAVSLGYRTERYKLGAFVLSAAIAGLAGATKALVMGVVTLGDAHWHASGEVILMTLVGGIGNLLGPVVGAVVIETLRSWLAERLGAWVTVMMGLIFLACVIAFRKGIVGAFESLRPKGATGDRAL